MAADPEVPTGNKMKWEEDEATLRVRDHFQGVREGSVIEACGCLNPLINRFISFPISPDTASNKECELGDSLCLHL